MADGAVIDADVAEALKQLKRGFGADAKAGAFDPSARRPPPQSWQPQPRPAPQPWEPAQKMPRLTTSARPAVPAKAAQLQPPGPQAAPRPNLMFGNRLQGGLAAPAGSVGNLGGPVAAGALAGIGNLGNLAANLRGLSGPTPFKDFGSIGGGPAAGSSGSGAVGSGSGLAAAAAAASASGKSQSQLEIPQSSIGHLIGNASTINLLKTFSGAQCFIDQRAPTEDKARVCIVGSAAEIDKCKRAVEGLVDGSMSMEMLTTLSGMSSQTSSKSQAAEERRPPGPSARAAPAALAASAAAAALAAPAPLLPSQNLPGPSSLSSVTFPVAPAGPFSPAPAATVSPTPAFPSAVNGGQVATANPLAAAAAAAAAAQAGWPTAPGLPGMPAMPGLGAPVLPGGMLSPIPLGPGGKPIETTPSASMQEKLNDYYSQLWSQYGTMQQQGMMQQAPQEPGDADTASAPVPTGPAAFDKTALARLAEQAAQNAAGQKPTSLPPETKDSDSDMEVDAKEGKKTRQDAPFTSPAGASQPVALLRQPPMPVMTAVSTEVRALALVGSLAPGAPPPLVVPTAPLVQPMVVAPQRPQEVPQAARPAFTSFTFQSTPQGPAQKDNASVQQMLQRLQGNAQQTKQAFAVQQVPMMQQQQQQLQQPIAQQSGTVVAAQETRHFNNAEWEALEQSIMNANAPQEIEQVGRQVLTKFPSLQPEQIAELLHKMESMLGRFHGDYLAEISRMLTARLKELTSTQFALLMSTFLLWSANSRERFADYAKDFFEAVSSEIISRLMELAPHELNCCLAAFTTLGYAEHKFFTAVGRSALARHKTFGPVQLSALLTLLSETRLVHVDLFNAAAQVIASRTRELRPVDAMRVLRAFAKCSVPHQALCGAVASEVVSRVKDRGINAGFKCEDLCEISWMLCVLSTYHEEMFRLMFKQLEETPQASTDALCQLYECHLALDGEHKEAYSKYRLDQEAVQKLLDIYKDNRKDGRRGSEEQRHEIATVLKSLVDTTVKDNHRTSIGLLVDVAALRKRSSTDGYIHIEIDTSYTVIRPLDQDDVPTSLVLDGSVALRRRILQKHGLRLVTVRENEWRALEDSKDKRRYLRSVLATIPDVLE